MEKIYLRKISEGEYNPCTNDTWKLEDVPTIWRRKVEVALEEMLKEDTPIEEEHTNIEVPEEDVPTQEEEEEEVEEE